MTSYIYDPRPSSAARNLDELNFIPRDHRHPAQAEAFRRRFTPPAMEKVAEGVMTTNIRPGAGTRIAPYTGQSAGGRADRAARASTVDLPTPFRPQMAVRGYENGTTRRRMPRSPGPPSTRSCLSSGRVKSAGRLSQNSNRRCSSWLSLRPGTLLLQDEVDLRLTLLHWRGWSRGRLVT